MSRYENLVVFKVRNSSVRIALEVNMDRGETRAYLYNTEKRNRKVFLNFTEQREVADFLSKLSNGMPEPVKKKMTPLTYTPFGFACVSVGTGGDTMVICKQGEKTSYSVYFPPQAAHYLSIALSEASEFYEKAVFFMLRSDGKDFYEQILPYIMAKCVEQETYPCSACRWSNLFEEAHICKDQVKIGKYEVPYYYFTVARRLFEDPDGSFRKIARVFRRFCVRGAPTRCVTDEMRFKMLFETSYNAFIDNDFTNSLFSEGLLFKIAKYNNED